MTCLSSRTLAELERRDEMGAVRVDHRYDLLGRSGQAAAWGDGMKSDPDRP